MKKQYTLLLLLAMTLLGVATQAKAQTPLTKPSINLTFEPGNENASLVFFVVAPTDGCWIDLNGDGLSLIHIWALPMVASMHPPHAVA